MHDFAEIIWVPGPCPDPRVQDVPCAGRRPCFTEGLQFIVRSKLKEATPKANDCAAGVPPRQPTRLGTAWIVQHPVRRQHRGKHDHRREQVNPAEALCPISKIILRSFLKDFYVPPVLVVKPRPRPCPVPCQSIPPHKHDHEDHAFAVKPWAVRQVVKPSVPEPVARNEDGRRAPVRVVKAGVVERQGTDENTHGACQVRNEGRVQFNSGKLKVSSTLVVLQPPFTSIHRHGQCTRIRNQNKEQPVKLFPCGRRNHFLLMRIKFNLTTSFQTVLQGWENER